MFSFLLVIYFGVEFLGHVLNFLRNCSPKKGTAPFYISANNAGELQFLHILAGTGDGLSLGYRRPHGRKQYLLSVVCISIVTDDVECLFVCLFHCISSWEKCLFKSVAHFSVGLFAFSLLSC